MDEEMQGLMDAIDKFFEKKGVELESKFHITKLLSEQYWEEFVGEEEELDDEIEDEVEEPEVEEPEVEDEVEDLEEVPDEVPELDVPKVPGKAHEAGMKKKLQSKAGKLKKPKIKVRP